MKQTKLDHLCRIVLPVSMRRNLGIKEGSRLEIRQVEDCIIIKVAKNACRLCGSDIVSQGELMLCQTCIEKIKKM